MSTVITSDTSSEEFSANHSAPKNILRSVYESVLTALQINKRVILITGDAKKGKTALIHTLSKEIAEKNRIIIISGKDLPSSNKHMGKSSNSDLYNMKDFFLESADLGDRLVVALDDADCLPINFLSELIEHAKGSSANKYSLQLIMSGSLTFKDQLMSIEKIGPEDLSHYPIDTFSEQVLQSYLQTKTYKISSNIKQLEFEPESLHTLADFIQADQQVLDVILEWCAALTKQDQLTSISSQTVNRAVNFAQQYAKDKNLHLDNAYPSSHEVYKYINNAQPAHEPVTKTSIKSDKKPSKTKSHNKKITQKTNIPTIFTKEVYEEENVLIQPADNKRLQSQHQESATKASIKSDNRPSKTKSHNKKITLKANIPTILTKEVYEEESLLIQPADADSERLQNQHAAEKESMPLQWTSPPKRETAKIISYPAMAGLIIFLLLSFITFIAFQVEPNPSVEESPEEQVALNPSEETIVEKQLTPEVVATTENTLDISVQPQKPVSVTVENINQNEPATAINSNNIATTQPVEQNKILSNTPDNDLSQEEQENILKPQESIHSIAESQPNEEVNKLLALAEQQLKNKQLSTPAGNNALETYQHILANDPNNIAALNGIKKVHDRYLNWANFYYQTNEVKRAAYFYNKVLSIDPNDSVAITNLQTIAQQEAIATTKLANEANTVVLENSVQAEAIQNLLVAAKQNMQQIEIDIGTNNRNYNSYQEAQTAYQDVLRVEPQNQQAKQGLSLLKNYYTDWAELQAQSKNYNIALFLYGQALTIEPENTQTAQRIEQLLALKNAF